MTILDTIESAISAPRKQLSEYAPRILTVNIPVERIGEVIGPGGKMIRSIVERTGAKIDIEDDGTVFITSTSAQGGDAAAKIINDMVRDVEIDEVYTGPVTRILNFGAFVEILPGREGLIRISDIDWNYVPSIEEVLEVGEEVTVKVAEIDDQGRINLSRKALLPKPEGYVERPPREREDRPRGGRPGGDRDRGRGGDRDRGRGRSH
jgi:polyribonucleotide nucleotidyltransferase